MQGLGRTFAVAGLCVAPFAITPVSAADENRIVKRAIKLEACHIAARARHPDRLFDQAMTQRRRAAAVADCVRQWELASFEHTGSIR